MSDRIKNCVFKIAAYEILIMKIMLPLYLVYFSRCEEIWRLKPPPLKMADIDIGEGHM